jgi:hypothetical protein
MRMVGPRFWTSVYTVSGFKRRIERLQGGAVPFVLMSGVLTWSVVLIGLVVAGFAIAMQVKKRLMEPSDPRSAGFTLSDLRALHREGKMSDAEFEKAKGAVVAAAKRAADQQDKAKAAGSSPLDRPQR